VIHQAAVNCTILHLHNDCACLPDDRDFVRFTPFLILTYTHFWMYIYTPKLLVSALDSLIL